MRAAWRLSPQSIDPLSWYSRPLLAGALGSLALIYGLGTVLITWRQSGNPLLDIVAVALMAGACFYVQLRAAPLRSSFGTGSAAIALAISLFALALSTWANIDSTVLVQYWWAPVGVASVLGALAPHSSALQTMAYGAIATVVSAACGIIGFASTETEWRPLSVALIAASTSLVGLVASTVFVITIVTRTIALFDDVGTVLAPEEELRKEAANVVERHLLARLGARVAPFLESLADAGVVTEDDRALAGQLARRLRSDLTETTNRSWLDAIADQGRLFVVDPDHRADRMNSAQRAALRALLTAALRTPGADAGSLFIELRGQEDGSTAVALSFDLELPEGRRSTMLAPYYLALQTTVSDLAWDTRRGRMTFGVPRD